MTFSVEGRWGGKAQKSRGGSGGDFNAYLDRLLARNAEREARRTEAQAEEPAKPLELPRADLVLTPEPGPAPSWEWAILPDFFRPEWEGLWTLQDLAQRLIVGAALRTAPKDRTGTSGPVLTVAQIRRLATPHWRPGRQPSLTLDLRLAERWGLISRANLGRVLERPAHNAVELAIRWPDSKAARTGPRVSLAALDGIRHHPAWRMALGVARAWWRPGVTLTVHRGGGTYRAAPEGYPTIERALLFAYPDPAARNDLQRQHRRRAKQALNRLDADGVCRIDEGRVLPSAVRPLTGYQVP